ncbi:MAG: PilZ domain-containing protein [Thiohalophilus sp.]|uniref:PilZ domain-containing protein n=1 Tax=Thiohalophilus sp. TaxID=3028392 RepID=UPI00286FB8F2|nr:PilZ domain-containing protein [Thiohalophilus sp.]MDR9435831.1 PilZ domain-containing protein [Thiohalophilus sp.]
MSDNERRHFTRICFDGEAWLIDPSINRQWQTEVIDISLRGAMIRRPTDGPRDFDKTYLLQLQLGEEIQLEFETRITHHDNPDHLGLHFDHMDLDSASHLHRLVELNLGDPALLERELAELLESD